MRPGVVQVPDGLLLAAFFGGQTLSELRAAIGQSEIETRGGISPRVSPMIDIRDAGTLLQRSGFALPVADAGPRIFFDGREAASAPFKS